MGSFRQSSHGQETSDRGCPFPSRSFGPLAQANREPNQAFALILALFERVGLFDSSWMCSGASRTVGGAAKSKIKNPKSANHPHALRL